MSSLLSVEFVESRMYEPFWYCLLRSATFPFLSI